MLDCIQFQAGRKSLADKFEYVMHGKIYKISEEGSGPNVKGYMFIQLIHLLIACPLYKFMFLVSERIYVTRMHACACFVHLSWGGLINYTGK